jgi:hypothetical protein
MAVLEIVVMPASTIFANVSFTIAITPRMVRCLTADPVRAGPIVGSLGGPTALVLKMLQNDPKIFPKVV